MRQCLACLGWLSLLLAGACSSVERPPARSIEVPGQQADGAMLLPNQWFLRPMGKQIVLGDFPVNIAIHSGGKFAAILHCGHGQHEITVVEIGTAKVVSRTA